MTDAAQMPIFERIVVGVDGGPGGRDALVLAALLQAVVGGELIAVNVYAQHRYVDLAHADRVEAAIAAEHRAKLEDELARVGVAARAVVVTESSPGVGLHVMADRHDAQLIVVGASHLTGTDRIVVGDDALGTLHGAPCAVAVAPRGYADDRHELRRIGVGTDDSPESRAAVDLACRLRRRAGARLRAMTIAPPAKPWKELASQSAELDLLVVGSRAHGAVLRLLLGSTSTKLVGRTACPLLVVPRIAHATAGAEAAETTRLRDLRTVQA